MQAADVFPESGVGAWLPRTRRSRRWHRYLGVMLLVLQLVAGLGWALDITTTDGHLYRSCTITQVDPDALHISYSDGAARIPYEKLPGPLQKQYFDPAKVAAYREEQEEVKRAAAVKADEDRRLRQIAAAEAQERRELEAEQRQREDRVRQRAEDEQKAQAKRKAQLRELSRHRVTLVGLGMLALGGMLSLFVYFLPTIIGSRKANAVAIFAMNLFLGWTLIGWVIALIWACTEDSAMERLARERLNAQPPPPAPPQPYQAQNGPHLEQGGGRQLEQGIRRLDQGGRYIEDGGRYLE